MTIRLEPSKRPEESRRYRHVWTPYLGDDTIVSEVTTGDGVDVDAVIEAGEQSVKFTISGGELGTVGRIVHTITTFAGDVETEEFLIDIAADELVSLTDAKRQVRMAEDDNEDAFIASLIAPARAYCERYSSHVFLERSITETFTRWGDYLLLSKRPVISVDAISYIDTDGNEQDYTGFVAAGDPVRIYPPVGESFPGMADGGTVTVEYTAGYPDNSTSEEPQLARQAMLLLIGHWFENRESVMVDTRAVAVEVPQTVNDILDLIRPVAAY
jgi:uncharacterized phiE125 gp8 family phage protein